MIQGQLGDKAEVNVVDALRLGGVAAHRCTDEIRTGSRAGQRILHRTGNGQGVHGPGVVQDL